MNLIKRIGMGFAVLVGAVSPALAQTADLGALTSAIDFGAVGTAVIAVAGSLAGIYVLWKGASLILRAIRGL